MLMLICGLGGTCHFRWKIALSSNTSTLGMVSIIAIGILSIVCSSLFSLVSNSSGSIGSASCSKRSYS